MKRLRTGALCRVVAPEWAGRPLTLADDLDGEPDADARAFYYERVRAALDRLDTADPPDPKEIGGIPLPVAIEGLKLSAPWTPVAA